jgi:group II intron reverse transcriptase/maturase
MISIETVFSKDNLLCATKKVSKKNSSGIDGISAKKAKWIINNNYNDIYKQLVIESYNPNKVLLKKIPKDNGGTRSIAMATVIDRCIQGCLNNSIYPLFEKEMSQNSFGFIKGKNCAMAVNRIKAYLENDYQWVIKVDLSKCFDYIDHNKILFQLQKKIDDPRIMRLINKYLKVTYITCAGEYRNFIGCPQGSALSPLFANIVMAEIDNEFSKRGYAFVRYADDIVVVYKSKLAAQNGMKQITSIIENNKLILNKDKTIIKSIQEGFCFLGFYIYQNNGIHVVPSENNYQRIRRKIKDITNNAKPDVMINRLNQEIRGWLNYYKDSEMNRKCNELDLFIKKELRKTEKRLNIKIDKSKLINCHEFYKKRKAS